MPIEGPTPPRPPLPDVRQRGFLSRRSVREAAASIAASAARLEAEAIAAPEAAGRVLASPVRARIALPAFDRAREDGFAVRAADTVGASGYGPVVLAVQAAGRPLAPGSAALVEAGAPLPAGADAVLTFAAAELEGSSLEVVAAAPEGAGVSRAGSELTAGAPLLPAGRRVLPHDVALLAATGVERVEVVRRPRVRLVVPGPKRCGGPSSSVDVDGPLLRGLLLRDGAAVESLAAGAATRTALAAAIAGPGADAVLVAGRTGTGPDDEAPLALAEVGALALHGVAMRPGGSAGAGVAGGVPVVLLPGEPLACLAAYELLASPLVRRLAGRDAEPAHATREAEVASKIVSAVGSLDVVQVRLVEGKAEPVGSVEEGGLSAAAQANGFVLVDDPLEGHAPGARVTVHLYGS